MLNKKAAKQWDPVALYLEKRRGERGRTQCGIDLYTQNTATSINTSRYQVLHYSDLISVVIVVL